MASKFIFVLAFIAAASAGYAPHAPLYHNAAPAHGLHAAPLAVAHNVVAAKMEEYDPHPQYKFSYGVDDKLTGDSKSQVEERDGDVVHGEYSLIDADGYKRIVHYTAGPHTGFNAVVHREPLVKTVAYAPVAVKSYAPVAHYAAPAFVNHVAPEAHYAAPAFVKSYAAPQDAHYASYSSPIASYHH